MEARAIGPRAPLRFAVVGTGAIAADFAVALAHARRSRVVSVVGTTAGKGAAFADRHRLPRAAASLAALLADPEVDAVYVATPHASHAEVALAAIDAGKAVLCEKPLATSAAAAERLVDAAARRGVFLMEGFMYRCHPMLAALLARLADGCIGTVQHVRATFGFRAASGRVGRLFAPALGGGAILDVGGYPVSFARLIGGLREGRPFAEPVELRGGGTLGPTGVDEHAAATLRFASGLTAEVSCAITEDLGTAVTLEGTGGRVELGDPWLPGGARQGLASTFTILGDGGTETVTVRANAPVFALEADLVAELVQGAPPALEAGWPAMSLRDTLGNLRVLDAWRARLLEG